MSDTHENAAHRGPPEDGAEQSSELTSTEYHELKRAATTAEDGSPDRVPSTAALLDSATPIATTQAGLSHETTDAASSRSVGYTTRSSVYERAEELADMIVDEARRLRHCTRLERLALQRHMGDLFDERNRLLGTRTVLQ